jgi:cytidine deaminase
VTTGALTQQMIQLARSMLDRAYAPYSGFAVAAVVRAPSGGLHAGCNVENAAYPLGWCAELSAIAALIGAGERQILEVVVMSNGDALGTPCGVCRQRLREFASNQLPIHICAPNGLRRTLTIGALLPVAFGPDNLIGARTMP